MIKKDLEINKWLAKWQENYYDWVVRTSVNEEENYDIDDIAISAITKDGELVGIPEEVKTIKGGMPLKRNGKWLRYYNTSNPRGIITKMLFGNVPPTSMDILDVPIFYEPEDNLPWNEELPEEMENKNVFILNAEDKFHRFGCGKWYKLIKSGGILTYIAPDGILTFNRTALKKAFLGYCWYNTFSHTTEFGEEKVPVWERKAVLDLDMGHYIEYKAPKELFERKDELQQQD